MHSTVQQWPPRVVEKHRRKSLSKSMPKLPALGNAPPLRRRRVQKIQGGRKFGSTSGFSMGFSSRSNGRLVSPFPFQSPSPMTGKGKKSGHLASHKLPQRGKRGYQRMLSPQTSMSFELPRASESAPTLPIRGSGRSLLGRHKCLVCMQRFKRPGTLDAHKRALHPWTVRDDGTLVEGAGTLPFQCKECKKRFAKREQYYAHKKLHTGAQVLSCEKCGKRMLVRRTGSKHARVHVSAYPPFDCVCGKRFNDNDALGEHLKHREVHRPFVCVCGHAFRQQVTVKIREDVRESSLTHMNEVGRRWTLLSFS